MYIHVSMITTSGVSAMLASYKRWIPVTPRAKHELDGAKLSRLDCNFDEVPTTHLLNYFVPLIQLVNIGNLQ